MIKKFFLLFDTLFQPKPKKKKVLILGYGRGGKDTLAEYLRDKYGYKFSSSSLYAAKKFIYKTIKDHLGYNSFEECYNDRHKWRDLWYNLITIYNHKDKSRLASEMLNDGYDMYVGMRNIDELKACIDKGIFDVIIWVDGTERTGFVEPESSCTVRAEQTDMFNIIVDNNGSLAEFYHSIDQLVKEGYL